jgi:hypothetical protein
MFGRRTGCFFNSIRPKSVFQNAIFINDECEQCSRVAAIDPMQMWLL